MIESNIQIACDLDYAVAYRITELTQKLTKTSVTLTVLGKIVNANNLLQLLSIAVKRGTPCIITAHGDCEQVAVDEISRILRRESEAS
ncbi:MAG: HPr family phosphocarrier protein [Puniceicoccales bacterium]|jgi:phosphotransferase system HPr-like phosphotransfer protein|nr:HPr family phosphocarrier protein [Puniceicoccales bacterium]